MLDVYTRPRVFKVGETDLEDPNPKWTVTQVREFYANTYPSIIAGEAKMEATDTKVIYTFTDKVGTKA